MSSVYIISDNGKLTKVNETLEFRYIDGTIRKIFPYKSDVLIVSGDVSFTGQAIKLLTRHGIDTIFLSRNGMFNGKLQFSQNKNVFLRQKQYKMLDDSFKCLTLAKSIVMTKLKNQLTVMQRIKRKKNEAEELGKAIASVRQCISKVENTDSLDKLRGIEGVGARNYFSVFKYNLIPEWASFPKRSKNPPLSNVNAVLSFLYTLLMYRVEAAIESSSLDPMVGFLHALDYGKNALVFDMMEEFRAPIVDTLCASVFNLGILDPEDFEEKSFDEEFPSEGEVNEEASEEKQKPIYLNKKGLNKVITAFEKKIESEIVYAALNKKMSFNRIIIEQVKHLKRVINEEETEYKGFLYR